MKRKLISIYLNDDERRTLDTLTATQDTNISALVRRWLTQEATANGMDIPTPSRTRRVRVKEEGLRSVDVPLPIQYSDPIAEVAIVLQYTDGKQETELATLDAAETLIEVWEASLKGSGHTILYRYRCRGGVVCVVPSNNLRLYDVEIVPCHRIAKITMKRLGEL